MKVNKDNLPVEGEIIENSGNNSYNPKVPIDYTTDIDSDLFYTDLDDLEFDPVEVDDNYDDEDNFGYK